MKKKSILLLCALTTFGAFAQKSLVDDVEHQIGGFNVSVDAYKEAAGNIKPDKQKSTEKIDGAVATIMALDRAVRNQNMQTESVYNERGLIII